METVKIFTFKKMFNQEKSLRELILGGIAEKKPVGVLEAIPVGIPEGSLEGISEKITEKKILQKS